jgi:alpha-glucosidase
MGRPLREATFAFGALAIAACASGGTAAFAPAPDAGIGDDEAGSTPPVTATDGGGASDAPSDAPTATSDAEGGAVEAAAPTQPVSVDHACSADLHLKVALLDDGVARFHYVSGGAEQVDRGWIFDVTPFPGPHAPVVVDDSATGLHLRTSAIDVVVSGAGCSIAVTSVATGESLWSESSPYAKAADGSVALGRALADGEAIYGLGEKTGAANRRGRAFTMWSSDPAWTDPSGAYQTTSDPIYESHPFFLSLPASGHATGAFLANTRHTSFDVGAATASSLAMKAAGGDVDLFFFDGPGPADVVANYTRLVGRAPLPPLWTLGYHQSRWTYTPASHVEDVAFTFRQKSLPIDGFWLDIDYMNGFRDFTWDPTNFPDPHGLLTTLGNNGFKVTTIVDPGIKYDPGGTYAAYNAGVAGGVFLADGTGAPIQAPCWPGAAVFPDFSNPSVRTWWGGQIGGFMGAGVSGLWIDMNEPAVFTKAGFPLGTKVNGEGQATTFDEIKNVYAFLMAKATREGQLAATPDRRPFVLTRAGFAGIQKYAAVWTGDAQSTWDFLAMQPSMFQGLGVSGVPFVGSDVGGFTGSPSAELYGRWFEVGAFSPFFRSHSATGTPNQEPYAFGPEIEDLAQRMLAVRYALLPYWYESFVAASQTGAPLVRPLWFDAPADAEARKHEDEWFVGPSILVAPALAANVTERDVYLPAGVFHDFYTGAAYTGPTTVTLPAPLGRVPVLVRGGSVIAEEDVENYVGEVPDVPRHLDVYPGGPGTRTTAVLTEDDGATMGYARGAQSTTTLKLDVTATGLTLAIGARNGGYAPPAARSIDVRIHGVVDAPSMVTMNGATTLGSVWREADRVVTIPIADFAAAQTIEVAYSAATLAPVRSVAIALDVTVPASTPAGAVDVAASATKWLPNGQALTVASGKATGTLTVPEGTLVKYKLTRGDWTTVEVDAKCADTPNRGVVAGWGTNGTMPVAATVAAWKDHCP